MVDRLPLPFDRYAGQRPTFVGPNERGQFVRVSAAAPPFNGGHAGRFGGVQDEQQGPAAAARGAFDGMDNIFPGGADFWAAGGPACGSPGTTGNAFPNMAPRQTHQPPTWEAVIRKMWHVSSYLKTYRQPDMFGTMPDCVALRTATSIELVTEPAAVAFLLTNEMGLAHVSWKQRECSSLGPVTEYSLRLQ